MKSNKFLFDSNLTRYQLVKSNPGKTLYNWLFLPGGPGIDSNYLLDLINKLTIEGNFWLIDLPLNGDNVLPNSEFDPAKIYQHWGDYFLSAVNKFKNPIVVGHSFGGYFPLFFPELEKVLKGLVILNSAPSVPTPTTINIEKFEKLAKENNLPYGSETIAAFLSNSSINTIREHYLSIVPFAFPKNNILLGIEVIKNLIFNIDTSYWWYTEGSKKYSTISWIPKEVPALILGGSDDFLTPSSLFEQDKRFKRSNIERITIPHAGHFPWIEQPALISDILCSFLEKSLV